MFRSNSGLVSELPTSFHEVVVWGSIAKRLPFTFSRRPRAMWDVDQPRAEPISTHTSGCSERTNP
jgi:hypothetical protein